MKYSIVLWIVALPFFAIGQNKNTDSLAKATLDELLDTWTLGIDSTSDAVDMKIYNRFKNLFDLNATINDIFDATYSRGEKTGSYKLSNRRKSFDAYAHDVALQIKNIRIDTVVRLSANTADGKNMRFEVAMKVTFQKTRKYVLSDSFATDLLKSRDIRFEGKEGGRHEREMALSTLTSQIEKTKDSVYQFSASDTVLIAMALEQDTARVTRIESRIGNFSCTNDADQDAVLNGEEEKPEVIELGDFTAKGRPDYDLDGVPDADDKCRDTYSAGGLDNKGCPPSYFTTKSRLDVFGGLQFNAQKVDLPALNELGYVDPTGQSAVDVLQSKKGVLQAPGSMPGLSAGANYAWFFGKRKKRVGVSVGITYAQFSGSYEVTDPVVYTFKSMDAANNPYRRQVSINALNEALQNTVFNFPLLVNYRFHLGNKGLSVINLKAGPSLLLFSTTSSYRAIIDFGGVYQIDTASKTGFNYYDYFNPDSKYNVYFTSAYLNSANHPGLGADSIFRLLRQKGYDFAANKAYNGSQSIQSINIAANIGADWQHKVSEGLIVKAGVSFLYAPSLGKKGGYKPIDKTTDEFQSIYHSNAKSGYQAVGVNVGVVYNF